MLRKTIIILAVPFMLSLPAWGADEASVPSVIYQGVVGTAATRPGEAKIDASASLARKRDVSASDVENVDCFYQEHASHPACAKASKAQVSEEKTDLNQKASY